MTLHTSERAPGAQPPSPTPEPRDLRPITRPNSPNQARAVRLSPWPAKPCPRCRTALDGGPVQFYCPTCRRAVFAADLDNEYHAPLRSAA